MLAAKQFRKMDWLLAAISLLLGTIGLVILYSLEVNSGEGLGLFYKQFFSFLFGIGLIAITVSFNYQHFTSYAWWLYGIGLASLVGVLLFGQEIRGLRGWFVLGPVSLQPVEFVKIIIILFYARFFSQYGHLLHQPRFLLTSIGLLLPFLGLILIQPDLGSAFIIGVTWVVMFIFTKVRGRQIAFLAVVGIILSLLSWQVMADYQKARLATFLNPEADPLGQGYNIRQAITAVGSGQFFGRGLGLGPQSQLRFLPENRTDFIYSVIAEELGFIGATATLLLFAGLLIRMLRIARHTTNSFGFYIALGVASFIAVQTFMNVAMNLSLFPVTGVPLPLISQGGSSLWAVLIGIGLVESVKIYE